MEKVKAKSFVKEPDLSYGRYTYADYLSWDMEEMVELIKGKVFKRAAAAPGRIHQRLAGDLYTELNMFLKGKSAKLIMPLLMSGFLSNPKKTTKYIPSYNQISA